MSAEMLREAAKVLRERAEATWSGPWEACIADGVLLGDLVVMQEAEDGFAVTDSLPPSTADYIATMHPSVGLVLAEWLDSEFAHDFGPSEHAITIASLILGGAS